MKLNEILTDENWAIEWLRTVAKVRPIILRHCELVNGKINVTATAGVNLPALYIKGQVSRLEVQFGVVETAFIVSSSKLSSLDGLPERSYSLSLSPVKTLTSLKGIHKIVREIDTTIYLSGVPIKDSILGLILIKGLQSIYYVPRRFKDDHRLDAAYKIVGKYLGQGNRGVMAAQQELLDAGLDAYAEL